LCQTMVFLKPNLVRATCISLSQFEPGNIITEDFIND